MKLDEVRRNVKKDSSGSFSEKVYRKIGVYVTWILVNLFPKISPNCITISLLIINPLASIFLYYAITKGSYSYLITTFIVINFAGILDSSDGNIARLNNKCSIAGVFIDRVVHNIAYPLFFSVAGFSIFLVNNNIIQLAILVTAGVFTELSPIETAFKDVEASFIRQILYKKTYNFNINNYKTKDNITQNTPYKGYKDKKIINLLKFLIKAVDISNILIITILIEWLYLDGSYYLSSLLGVLIIAARIAPIFRVKIWSRQLYYSIKKLDS